MYSKTKINLRLTIKDKYNKKKQIRALMSNLIHSLDSSLLSLLFNKFFGIYENVQFYFVYNCFGTTIDKIDNLKTLLASVYIDIYSNNIYLDRFDKCILDNIENSTHDILNKEERIVKLTNTKLKDLLYYIYNIE